MKSDSSTSDLLRETDACDVVMINKNSNSSESRIGPGQNSERESTASIELAAGNRVLDNDETVLQIDLEKSLQEEPLECRSRDENSWTGNCELHEVQQRPVKVQCQLCQAYVEAGFQVCPCGGKLDKTEDMLSRKRRKFRELSLHAVSEKCGYKHGVLPFQEHHLTSQRNDEQDQANGEVHFYSWPLPRRRSFSWMSTGSWLDWSMVHSSTLITEP